MNRKQLNRIWVQARVPHFSSLQNKHSTLREGDFVRAEGCQEGGVTYPRAIDTSQEVHRGAHSADPVVCKEETDLVSQTERFLRPHSAQQDGLTMQQG